METVECQLDAQNLSQPLSVLWMGTRREVAEVFAHWRGPGESGFCVKTTDGMAFELTYQEISDDWHVQPYRRLNARS